MDNSRSNEELLGELQEGGELSEEKLLEIAVDSNKHIRWLLASSSKITKKVQEKLVSDKEVMVRRALGGNPILTTALQLQLVDDPVPEVRWALAENSGLSKEAQLVLATTTKVEISTKKLLAQNPAITREVQEALLETGDEAVWCALAQNPAVESKVQYLLWEKKGVRETLASYTKLPYLQRVLADDEVVAVLRALARNKEAKLETQLKLSHSKGRMVVETLCSNPRLLPAVAVDMYYRGKEAKKTLMERNPRIVAAIQECEQRAVKNSNLGFISFGNKKEGQQLILKLQSKIIEELNSQIGSGKW